MRITTPTHTVDIDERRFSALCRLLAGPDAAIPSLGILSDARIRTFLGATLAFYEPRHNVIFFVAPEIAEVFAEERATAANIMQCLVAHEIGHYLCLTAPDDSFWCRLHNAAHRLVLWIADRIPDDVHATGPGSVCLWLLNIVREVREHAADRIALRHLDAHREKFESLCATAEEGP